MASSIITLLRLAALGVTLAFSLIVLATGAHIIFVTSKINYVWDFTALGVAVGALTIATVTPLLVISVLRKGALPNYIVVESAWFSVLWVLWLAAAALTANDTQLLQPNCAFNFIVFGSTISCHEPLIMEAFAWLNWLIFFGYSIIILVLAIIQHTRNNPVWTKSVNEVDFFAPSAAAPDAAWGQKPVGYAPQQIQPMYPQQPVQHQPVQPGYPPAPGTYVTTPPPQQGSGYPQV